ncbi:MAG: hypothetical protein LBS59_04575, partial [Puniceicoccales bacterium]|nr:hypothetical protein [Puniceicoccales bacterium]
MRNKTLLKDVQLTLYNGGIGERKKKVYIMLVLRVWQRTHTAKTFEAKTQVANTLALVQQLYKTERERDAADARARSRKWPPGSDPPTQQEQLAFRQHRELFRQKRRKRTAAKILPQLHETMQTWRKIALPKSRRGQAAGYYFNHQTKLEAIYVRGDVR